VQVGLLEQLQRRPVSESRSHKIGSGPKLSSPAGPRSEPRVYQALKFFVSARIARGLRKNSQCCSLSHNHHQRRAPNAGATAPPCAAATAPPRRCHHHRLHQDKHDHHRRRHRETTTATNIHAFGVRRSSAGARSTHMDH
jgi:hypothetical protein